MTRRLFSNQVKPSGTRIICGLVLAAFITAATAAQGKELVKKFSGNRSTDTVEFEVQAPWLLDWWVNSEYPQALGLEVSLINARTGQHAGYLLKTKQPGNGLRLFDQSGVFRLKVDATMANWILKVEQLTREEAEQYTPVDKTKF
jgi:hypothetical protein